MQTFPAIQPIPIMEKRLEGGNTFNPNDNQSTNSHIGERLGIIRNGPLSLLSFREDIMHKNNGNKF